MIVVHGLLFVLEWWVAPLAIFLVVFSLIAEFDWWCQHRPLSLRRARKIVNKQTGEAIHKMELVAQRYRSSRTSGWW